MGNIFCSCCRCIVRHVCPTSEYSISQIIWCILHVVSLEKATVLMFDVGMQQSRHSLCALYYICTTLNNSSAHIANNTDVRRNKLPNMLLEISSFYPTMQGGMQYRKFQRTAAIIFYASRPVWHRLQKGITAQRPLQVGHSNSMENMELCSLNMNCGKISLEFRKLI